MIPVAKGAAALVPPKFIVLQGAKRLFLRKAPEFSYIATGVVHPNVAYTNFWDSHPS